MTLRDLLLASALAMLSTTLVFAQETPTPPGGVYKSSIPPELRRAYFGEMHLHTTMSFDAWSFGTKITPDQAYKFARGETVMVPIEQVSEQQHVQGKDAVPAKRSWPLDFMAVTDHSEAMGMLNQLDDPNNPIAKSPMAQVILKDPHKAFYFVATAKQGAKPPPNLNAPEAARHAWDVEVKAANDNYEPGKFTTFIAYEWTSMAEGKYNLHRNVFFNSDHAPLPFTSADSNKPEDLWAYLDKVRAQGIDVFAAPHNGNVSGGLMYDWNDSSGKPIDEQYAQERALNEPLTEITQNKGTSDTMPELSPTDEFANFEIFDHLLTYPGIKSAPNGSYIRQAFGRGLVIESKVGVNPYKYGVIGASDIHNGLSTSDESGMASGPFGIDPKTMLPTGDAAKRDLDIIKTPALLDMDAVVNHAPTTNEAPLVFSSAGITGVWAEENTRNSIFAAMKRKETFATSGTRIRVRMFGGWDFDPKILENGDWVAKAYADGVPMGGDLPAKPATGSAPRFILQAVKDPDGANLDRIQIIKLWLEGGGYKEKLFDVALSGNRKDNPKTGRAPMVGNTVNLKTGSYKNTIGAAMLTSVWQDPEFDATKSAVYYARVLEIPTPRWSTLLAIKNKLPIPKSVPATIQERGWTSPIWFTPVKS
jgi:Protein of unknown function (DUF3604)